MFLAAFLFLSGPVLSAQDGPPEISRGVRVLMGDSTVIKEKNNAWAWTFFVPQQLEVLEVKDTNAAMRGTVLSNTEDVISFFSNLPAHKQQNGLWVTYIGRDPTTNAEKDRFSRLTTLAKKVGLMLLVCMPAQATTPRASFVAWRCEKVSPQQDIPAVNCQPKPDLGPSGSPQWSCAWVDSTK